MIGMLIIYVFYFCSCFLVTVVIYLFMCGVSTLQGTSYENMTVIVKDYVEGLINKYPYWNRTLGADHFFVTCHDVGVRAFEGLQFMVKNSIRVVCSPSYNVDFIPHKDIALPQVLQPFALHEGGNDIDNRLVFVQFKCRGDFLLCFS